MALLRNSVAVVQSLLIGSFFGCHDKPDHPEILEAFTPGVYRDDSLAYPLPYRLYVPPEMSSAETYPLVLYLHSGGPRGNDNASQLEFGALQFVKPEIQSLQKCFVLVPQCPGGSQWLNTTFRRTPFTNVRQDDIPESDAMKMVVKLITRLVNEFSVDVTRIYVTGPSMGGSGTWDIITRYPDLFAAAVPVNGVSDPSKADVISHLPVWAFHGEKDAVSDVNNTRNMIHALRKSGSTCKYTEYLGQGHAIASRAYSDPRLCPWLFKQKKESLK